MSAGFTLGPWHYLDMGEIVPSDNDGLPNPDVRICFMATPGSAINAHERIEANARLIAAAPELYEALEICLAMGERELKKALNLSGQSPYDIGIAAIRKARGEQ